MKQNIFSKKNQLDEMQEQTLRKIESRGWKNACAMAFGTATSRPALVPALWAAWSVVCFPQWS